MNSVLYIGKVGDKNKQPCESVFRLAGSNEDALTFALGYLLAKDPVFCVAFLKKCGVIESKRGKQWAKLLNGFQVHLQEVTNRDVGRRDVVIELEPKFRVVLEAKIGSAVPTSEQLLKYAKDPKDWDRFDPNSGHRAIVALTRDKLPRQTAQIVEQELRKLGIKFHELGWNQVYSLVQTQHLRGKSRAPAWLFDEFIRFFRRDYEMKHYDAEVAIQDVNAINAKIYFDGWMYVTNQRDKTEPLYFAPYLTKTANKGESHSDGISYASRVLWVEDAKLEDFSEQGLFSLFKVDAEHLNHWKFGLEKIKERARQEDPPWYNKESRLYFLDKPFKFRREPLTKRKKLPIIPNQIPKGFNLTFEQLLEKVD